MSQIDATTPYRPPDPEDCSNHYNPIRPTKLYGKRKCYAVKTVYVVAILIWFLIIAILKLWQTDLFGFLILSIPVVAYFIGMWNANNLTVEVEEKTFSISYISISLLVVIPLVTWVDRNFNGNRWYLAKIIVVAVVLALISLIDIWVRPRWVSVVRHVKSALQTASLTLLVFALYVYYMNQHRAFPRT